MDLQKTNRTESDVKGGKTAEVKKVIEEFAAVIREGQLDRVMSFYSSELTAFDMMPPLRFNGVKEYRQIAWKECFTEVFQFPVQYDYSEQKLDVVEDLAIMHALVHMSGLTKEGEQIESWLRTTLVLKQFDDEWLITHEHNSAPSDVETGAVLMNLKPYESTH